MTNARVIFKNAFDHPACVLSCTAVPVLALDHLKDPDRNRITRIPASPAFSIKGTYGGMGVYASGVSMQRVNIEPAGTIRFQGYSDAAWTTQVVDTGTVAAVDSTDLGDLDFGVEPLGSGIFDPFYGQKFTLQWFTRTLLLSWKLTIDDTGNSSGYVDISRGVLGDYFELTENPPMGPDKLGWKENTQQWDTDGGGLRVDRSIPFRTLAFDISCAPEADRAKWFDAQRYAGMGKDILVCMYPDGTGELLRDYTLLGYMTSLQPLSTSWLSHYNGSVVLREV